MNPIYRNAEFLTSAAQLKQLPPDEGAEVVFAGRSNAGKSSAINALCGQKALARTSKTPGRTQLINFFRITPRQRLVDLPGYGYAKVPEAVRLRWQRLLEAYIGQRRVLRGMVLIMDIRHPLTDYDRQMMDWAAAHDLPIHILLTKADKLKRGPALNTLQQVQRELASLASVASVQVFSALKRQGLEELQEVLDTWLGFSTEAVD